MYIASTEICRPFNLKEEGNGDKDLPNRKKHIRMMLSPACMQRERDREIEPAPLYAALRLVNEERNDTVADFRHKQQPQQLLLKKPDKV